MKTKLYYAIVSGSNPLDIAKNRSSFGTMDTSISNELQDVIMTHGENRHADLYEVTFRKISSGKVTQQSTVHHGGRKFRI